LERTGEMDAITLAEHFERAGDARDALTWCGKAARQALEGNDLAGALDFAERAIQWAITCEAPPVMRGEMLLVPAIAWRWRSDHAPAGRRVGEAADVVVRGSTAWFRAVSEAMVGSARRGLRDGVLRWAREARGADSSDSDAQLLCLCRSVMPLISVDELSDAE